MLVAAALVGAATAAGTVAAAAAVVVQGRVVESGRAVSGATVTAVPYESPFEVARREARGGPAPSPVATAETASDGRFRLVLPAGSPLVQVRVGAPGAVALRSANVFDGAGDAGVLSLSRAVPLAGHVVDPQGRPVAGARVRLEPGGPGVTEAPSALTDADGAFRFEGASASGNRVDVEKDGFGVGGATGLPGGGAPVRIVLPPPTALTGVVRRPDGKAPAAAALVRYEGAGRSRWVEASADGTFRIADGVAGAGRLVADGGAAGRGETRVAGRSSASIAIVLEPPTRIAGRVVNARTLQPVPGVRVVASSAGGPSTARAGSDGRYSLDVPAPGAYTVSVEESRYAPFERRGVRVGRGESVTVDVPLSLGASVSGRVLDEKGQPLAGAVVRVESGRGRFGGFRMRGRSDAPESPTSRTGADGAFRLERLAAVSNARLTVSHPDFVEHVVGGITLAAGAAKTGLTVVMKRGLEITGTVRDGDGRPVAGAEISLLPSPSEGRAGGGPFGFLGRGPGRGDDGPSATSGADGRFRVAGLEPGAYSLDAHRDGLADAHIDVVRIDPESVPPAVDVWMMPGAAIRGAVRHADGTGARGVVVMVRAESGGGARGFPFGGGGRLPEPTGDDGAFSIEGLREGETYTLAVLGGGAPPQEQAGIVAPADGVDIVVGGTGQIAGHAIDAQTRRPLTGFRATYEGERGPGFGGGPGGRGFRGRPPFAPGDDTSNDDDAPASTDGSFLIKDVPPGTWTVVVDADGYETARVGGVAVKDGETSDDVEVRATRGRILSGRAVESLTGRPVPGVSVTASSASGGGPGAFGQATALSDADGRFELTGLAPGSYRVQARHPDYADASQLVEVQQDQATVEIRLDGGGTLAGFVVSPGGAPVAGAAVDVRAGGGGGGGFRFGGGGGQPSTVSDESGAFRVDRLSAGVYRVSASLGAVSSAPVEVPLVAGQSRQDVRVVLGGGATVRGRVSGLGADLRGSVAVAASGPNGFVANARPTVDGAFSLSGIPEGSTRLRAMAGTPSTGMRSASTDVDIAEGQTEAEAEIVFSDGFSLRGTVTRGGQPVPGTSIMARVAGQGPAGAARTDDGGGYTLVGLGEGDYTVEASPPRGAAKEESVHMDGDETLDFALPPSGVSGVVVEAGSGQPLANALVSADAGGGAARGARAETDSNGSFAIEGLEPRPYVLTATLAGYAYEKRTVDVGASGDPVRIELKRGDGLDFRALDAAFGVPLNGLFAEAKDASRAVAFAGRVSLDSEGRGRVPSLGPGSYRVRFAAPGYAPLEIPITIPSPALDVRFGAGGAVEIHVGGDTLSRSTRARLVDSASGEPFALSPFEPDGWFALTTAVQKIDHVTPGAYTLEVAGGTPNSVTVAEGGTAAVDLP